MALSKELQHQITVLPDGQLEVREATIIKENGVELSRSYHRKVIDVGDDVSAEPSLVKDIANGVHTPARVAARVAARAAHDVN